MKLLRLSVSGFRNLPREVLDVDAPLIAFVGDNGQGKTNWLEAVGVLGTLRSFRSPRAAELLAWGGARAEVEGVVQAEGMVRTLSWSFGEGARTLRRDDRPVDAVTWLSSFRATYFVPGDIAPVRGEPALRRALLDRAVLAIRPGYLALARDFKRVVDHKSALLRSGRASDDELDVYDAQLAPLGAAVTSTRAEVVAAMGAAFERAYTAFAGTETATVTYEPWLGEGDEPTLAARYAERLARGRAGERQMGRVLAGPQRDDVAFAVGGRSARAFASQGQARSVVLAWKLAELEAARAVGEAPLFLLDDLGSELDPGRTARLVGLLGSLGVQIFLTTTDARYVPRDTVAGEARLLRVVAGVARPDA
ncbi:MAG: DNA replication and repair protein RecF [Pseudomonadota bacterium]|nr:DNA replication and repair protein RecF [Pseudomonadota bacterium]